MGVGKQTKGGKRGGKRGGKFSNTMKLKGGKRRGSKRRGSKHRGGNVNHGARLHNSGSPLAK